MSRLDDLREVLWLEALASEALAEAGKRRAKLQLDAEAEYKRDGHAGTWNFPEIAKVILPVSRTAVVVTDAAKFQRWVEDYHPAEIVTTSEVRPSFQKNLIENVADSDGDVVFMPGSGEVIPGLGVRAGGTPRAITIKAEPGAKEVLALSAAEGLKRIAVESGPNRPVVVAELTDAGS